MRNVITCFLVSFSCVVSAQMDTMAYKSPEAITEKMLEFISCDIGEEKNWDEYRNLFLPTAQKYSINRKAPPGRQIRSINLEQFVRYGREAYPKDGFNEIVIGTTVNEFNGIANVFQAFYCKNLTGTYEARGVNSFQLIYEGNRWWIASTTFTNESEEEKLPNDLLFPEFQK